MRQKSHILHNIQFSGEGINKQAILMPRGVNKDHYDSTYPPWDNFLKKVQVHIYSLRIDDFGDAEESVSCMFMPFISSRK